jgi:ATP-binding cassette subfamily B protein
MSDHPGPRPAKSQVFGFGAFTKRFALPLWPWYAGGFLLLAAVNLVSLQIPQLAKIIINSLTTGADLNGLRGVALAIVGLGFLLIIIRSLSRIVIFWPGRRVETASKSYFFGRVLRLSEEFFTSHGMGDLISRLANDIAQLRAFYAFGVLQVLNVIFLTVFAIARMASVHLMLTICSLIPLGVMFIITRFAMPRMHTYSRDNLAALGTLTNRVTEAFVNVHVIQANGATPSFAARVEAQNAEVLRTSLRLVYVRMFVFPLMTCLAGVSQLIVLFYGGQEVIAGRLSVGDILAFNVYIGLLTFPLSAMGIILALYQRAKTALERIGDIELAVPQGRLSAEPGSNSDAPQQQPPPLLEVRGLSFRFPSSATSSENEPTPLVLDDVSFSLAPGGRLGLFGSIGSGKSTLFNLITRIYEPPAGTIFWRGVDVRSLEPTALRQEIGYALQQVHLFSASIRANLAFGLTPVPPEVVLEEAARGAQILPEILAFAQGWDTEIGERGVRLSGGQKQRLALARLLVRKPPLLLLDDVLSALDQVTETKLLEYIYGVGSGLIIASHRGSALERCDQILILEHGKIAARGCYLDLVERYPELDSTK